MCDKDRAVIPVEQMVAISRSNQATAEQLSGMVQQLGAYLIQLDARMRRQEELLQRRVTISHTQHKQLLAAIRKRASELSQRYRLPKEALAALRTELRHDLLRRYAIRELHDLPESAMGDALRGVSEWDSYSAVRRLRQKYEGGDMR